MAVYQKLATRIESNYQLLRQQMSEIKDDLQATKDLLNEAFTEVNGKIQELTEAVENSTIDEETKALARDVRAQAQALADIVKPEDPAPVEDPAPQE